eukprot:3711656-Amphidinium_carterae.1
MNRNACSFEHVTCNGGWNCRRPSARWEQMLACLLCNHTQAHPDFEPVVGTYVFNRTIRARIVRTLIRPARLRPAKLKQTRGVSMESGSENNTSASVPEQ